MIPLQKGHYQPKMPFKNNVVGAEYLPPAKIGVYRIPKIQIL